MNILLAVDGSPYTKKMLAYLAAHDEMLGTSHSYTAITVQPQLPRARAPRWARKCSISTTPRSPRRCSRPW